MSGDERSFTENSITVTHNTWVRLLTAPFSGTVDTAWINARLLENTVNTTVKDVLAHAMDYIEAGTLNAKYGPNDSTEGSDFNDYLGITYTYTPHWSTSLNKLVTSWTDGFETSRATALDCSGFMRMVWGYRMGVPMCFNVNPNDPNGRMPRRSFQIWDNAPGRKVMTDYVWNAASAADKLASIRIGDLVFFNADTSGTDEKTRVDHVGMYIGRDGANNMRFIHSRKSDNVGPTFTKDLNGKSILNNDGTGQYFFYVRSLVGARRI
jgi:cell wall-associated NlpC family hydrolase